MAQYIAQEQRADNDPNGNPQRLTVVSLGEADNGTAYALTTAVIDHGFAHDSAEQAFRFAYGNVPVIITPSVRISKSAYHALLRWARATGNLIQS